MSPTLPSLGLVALGGALGSAARFALSGWVLHHTVSWRFPLGTFVVNLAGCLAIGLLAGAGERYGLFSAETRLLLMTGLLGGFTTFSAFGLETLHLLRRGEWLVAGSYVGLSVLLGLALVWIGFGAVAARSG
ncbi:fluoride efflux transporter CrcB [Coralloluteibacterium thermophilus]|uniref:Fluoride-specific ion channel FluC n=1 Tax=Coralloluteibacterium thermophilum TaxID=2707049 RepID=A0ABV9NIC0_9GAMM